MSPAGAPAARKVLFSLKDRISWALKFNEELVNCPAAKQAFERLIAAGCDPEDLLFWIDFCCQDDVVQNAISRRERGQEIESFGRQLLDKAKKLQKFEASQNKRGLLKASQLPEFRGLSKSLQAYAQCLMSEAGELKRGSSAREAPRLATAWLVSRVEGSTGEPHYSEIARLMEAHYSMRRIHKDISIRAVERKATRFSKKHPLAYSHMRGMARRQHNELTGRWPKFREERKPVRETEWMRVYEKPLKSLHHVSNSFHYESKFLTDSVQLSPGIFKKKWATMKPEERYEFALAYKEKREFTRHDEAILTVIMQDGDEAVWSTLAEFMLRHPRRDKVLKFIRARVLAQPTPPMAYLRVLGAARDKQAVPLLIRLHTTFRRAAQAAKGDIVHLPRHIVCCQALWEITGSEEYERELREYLTHPSDGIRWWAKQALGHDL